MVPDRSIEAAKRLHTSKVTLSDIHVLLEQMGRDFIGLLAFTRVPTSRCNWGRRARWTAPSFTGRYRLETL